MSRHIEINTIDPMQIPSFAMTRNLAKAYAERFSADNGDSVQDYVSRVGLEVYPTIFGRRMYGDRADFRRLLRSEIRSLQTI